MQCRDDNVETVGDSIQLQSVVGKVNATTLFFYKQLLRFICTSPWRKTNVCMCECVH